MRASIVASVLTLACALTGCASPGARGEPGVLTIADNVDPTSLNPLLAHDQDTIGYDLLVTQTLVGLSADNRLVPILVTRVPTSANGDISPDGKHITYRLRRDVRFADGVAFTSADVAFTYRAILDPHNPVESQDAYRRVAALRTPDAHTVVIDLHQRWNAAIAELFAQADFAFGILPAHAFDSTDVTHGAWNERPFGTGPFRVARWERASRIVLVRNEYYRPAPKLREIVFALIPDTQSALVALRSGQVDVAELNPAQIPDARGVPNARVVTTPINGEYMLILSTTTAPTDDVAVRRAIDAAIDRTGIVRGSFGTLAPADSFLPPVFAWHDPSNANGSRPAGVAALLEGAGYRRVDGWWGKNGKRLGVTIDLQPERGTWMELIEQEQLRRAGIDAELKTFPASQFNAADGPMRSGHFTIAATQWIGGADPEQSVIVACSQRGINGNNASNYCNPRFDALFADQATTADAARRAQDFIEMQRIVRRDVPIVPIAFESTVDIVRNRVNGFRRNMLMYPVNPETWTASP